jgi:hypothetical protein
MTDRASVLGFALYQGTALVVPLRTRNDQGFSPCQLSFAPDTCNCRDIVPRLRQPCPDGILRIIYENSESSPDR